MSITIASGKCAAYRSADALGSSPHTNLIPATDGAMCVTKSADGICWYFRIYDEKLYYQKSADAIGTPSGSWVVIVSAGVKDGVPTAEVLENGRIEVCYWKGEDENIRLYRSYSDNGMNWQEEEVT